MLEDNDIKILEEMFDRSDKRTGEKIVKSENMILKELDIVQSNLQTQINELRKNVTDNSQIGILLTIIEDLRRRIEELERRTA